ncbi:MAG: hypothetical protein U9Q33_02475 [Campylobacterota bacterium]|nr:hypothetical protein [Campylobacterota bacterium]
MYKIMIGIITSGILLSANTSINISQGEKDYTNSKKKIDGKTSSINISHKYKNGDILLGYLKDDVSLITNPKGDLDVKKYNVKYQHNIIPKLNIKASYIKIIDNQAPTDQGKVYGIGTDYKITKGVGVKLEYYKSDYKPFNVNQYDLSIYKGFKLNNLKAKFTIGSKVIKIDGDTYNPDMPIAKQYNFKDKSYNPIFVKMGLNYQGFTAGIGAFFGKRMFTVLDGGTKVQHHAMQQDKTYMLKLAKSFQNIQVGLKYSFQNGDELPENQKDVDTKVTSLFLQYKF